MILSELDTTFTEGYGKYSHKNITYDTQGGMHNIGYNSMKEKNTSASYRAKAANSSISSRTGDITLEAGNLMTLSSLDINTRLGDIFLNS